MSSAASSLVVELAVRGAEITALGAALMLGGALVIRRSVRRHEAARAHVAREWRPILTRVAVDEEPLSALPPIKRRHVAYVLEEWNAIQDAVRGAGTERLNALARVAGLDAAARRMMGRGNISARILAIRTFGHLRDGSVWARLERELASPNALASFCAASALIQIDPPRAMPHVMQQVADHEHWPAEAVARLLKEAGADNVREPLRAFIYSSGQAARIASVLQWLGRADPALAGEIAAELIRSGYDDPRIVSKALLVLQDATLLPLVRPLAHSSDLGVRKNLATALGRLGGPEDASLIIELMGDRVWWVRYRAAQALARLRGMTHERLEAVRASLTDRFARDMLDHVVAEGPAE